MLNITTSNRFEVLLDGLVESLAHAPADPFEAQHVIVPSKAVQRKIELALADRLGICANVEFSYLGAWLWRQIGRLVNVADDSPFAPEVLAWRIYARLGDDTFVAAHPRLRRYLSEADARMRLELAQRIARLFDQYITFRPDWMASWAAGRSVDLGSDDAATIADEAWQAALWRGIAHALDATGQHPSQAFFAKVERAGPEALRAAGIPGAAHVFCLPAIPPLYLDMLRQLARFVDLRLAVLNPCAQYWHDIVDARHERRLAMQGRLDYHEVGNRLLASWGKQQQAQLGLLLERAGDASVDDERFERNGGESLLAHVQDAILDLRDFAPGSLAHLPPDDRSIEVHASHSLTRELEALHDYLLGLFAQDATLRPADILVVTPDLDAAAPLVDAVFGSATGPRRIPYGITGRARSSGNPAARALLDLLALASSRFAASEVVDLLQQPIVGRCFGVDPAALERIREWVRAAGIRWGLDGEHRAACGLPGFSRHSFDDGLDRLWLGYALPAEVAANPAVVPFDERLPAGDAEGTAALALGSLAAFVQALAALRREVLQPKTPGAWMQVLQRAVATFLAPARDEIEDLREVQSEIGALHGRMRAGGLDEALPLAVLRQALQDALDDPARGGVPTGSVTFSAMTSLRSLPWRVIGVVGLNDGAWPGNARPAEFDLMAMRARPGDRQRREDDRNAFLDLLLAARERLYLSYVGRSVRDNASMPPSVLVAELLDVLVPALAPAGADEAALATAHARLVVEHPLQAFSTECFASDDPRKRSFDAEYCAALVERSNKPARSPQPAARLSEDVDDELEDEDAVEEALAPFFAAPLALDGDAHRTVALDQLVRFYCNPSAWLLRNRLGIRLDDVEEELDDDEPFVADWRARGALAARLLPACLAGRTGDELRALARAGTEYPPGRLGERLLERELAQIGAFAARLAADAAAPCLPPVEHTLTIAVDDHAWRLTGAFGDLRPCGLVRHRYDDVRPTDYLDGWLRHVFLNVLAAEGAAPAGVEPVTRWHSRDGHYDLARIEDPHAVLAGLLRGFERGQVAPLHFYPKSAWAYVTGDGNLGRAQHRWNAAAEHGGEKHHRAYRLALRGVADPLDAEFEQWADAVLDPLLAAITDARIERGKA